MNEADLALLSAMMRQMEANCFRIRAELQEMAFFKWKQDTLFCEATNRWFREIGERV